jgi:hypothetical protein
VGDVLVEGLALIYGAFSETRGLFVSYWYNVGEEFNVQGLVMQLLNMINID